MSNYERLLDSLEDLRARVIYYSCIAEPKNILEIAKIWDYKTATYFYQKTSKKIIEEMIAKKIVFPIKGARFESNYELLVNRDVAQNFFENTNKEISNEIIVEKYDFEVSESQLEDSLFKEFCLEKKPELKPIIKAMEINEKEIDIFLSLWKDLLFRKVFLSTDCIKRLIEDRQRLPQDPTELLFSMTVGICESVYFFKEGGHPDFPDPYLWLDIDEIFPLIIERLQSVALTPQTSKEIKPLAQNFRNVYEIMKKKFMIYQGRSEITSFHIAKFVEAMNLYSTEA